MHSRAGVRAARSELLVVLVIALIGIAAATAVVLAPWHPTWSGHASRTGAVVRLDSPPHHAGPPFVVTNRR